MRRGQLIVLASILALLAGLGAIFLRPDPAAAARALAARVAAATFLPAQAVGPARLDWGRDPRLDLAGIEIAGLGTLSDVVAQGEALDARATLLGHAGRLALRAGVARFSADGLAATLDAGGTLTVETAFAGRKLRLAGRPDAGGIAGLTVEWDGHALAGTARYAGSPAQIDVAFSDVAGTARLSGRLALAGGTFAGELAAMPAPATRLDAALRADREAVELARLSLQGPDIVAEGTARRGATGAALDLRAERASLGRLADFAARLAGAGDLDVKLRVGRVDWPSGEAQGLFLVASLAAGRIAVEELAVRSLGEASLRVRDGRLDLQAPDAERFLSALGVAAGRHLGALSLSGAVTFDAAGPGLRVAPLELALAGQRVAGSLDWRGGRLALDLAGDRVALDPFFGPPLAAPPVRGPLLTRSQAARAAAAAALPPPGPGGWSRVPLRLDLAGGLPVDLTLVARELAFGGLALGDARLAARVAQEGIEVTSLAGGLLGGSLRASGRVVRAPAGIAADFALDGAEWARLLALFGAGPALRGPVSLKGTLSGAGADPAALVAGLDGMLALDGPGGTLDGLDLPGLFADAAAGTADLVALSRRLARGGRGAFGRASGTWTIERGRARSADTRIAAPGGALEIAGTVDVAGRRLDLSASAVVPGARGVPRVRLAGPPERADVTLSVLPSAGPPAGSGAPPRAPAARR
jgi:hypothetical protein